MSHILLVEDDPCNRTVIEDIVEFDDVNAELTCVETGEEALDCLHDLLPDLILMDVGLPGIDGLETTRRLKLDPILRDIPVWALTAHAMIGDAGHALESGCSKYITKPIDSNLIAQQLREFFFEIGPKAELKSKPEPAVESQAEPIVEPKVDDSVSSYKLLIVNDDPKCQAAIAHALESDDYEIRSVGDGPAALDEVKTNRPDLVLLNANLPQMNGVDVLQQLKSIDETRHVPVIMVTTLDADSKLEECFKNGAIDHISQPFSCEAVRAQVRSALRSYRELQSVLSIALSDVLTGLPNRRAFDEELVRRFQCWSRRQTPFAVAMFDLNHFETVNEIRGHAGRDNLLLQTAKLLRDSFRSMDFVARLEGEMFAAILPQTHALEATPAVVRAIRAVASADLLGDVGPFTMSINAGAASIRENETAEQLVQRVAKSLDASKTSGRNCVHIHNGESIEWIVTALRGESQSVQTSNSTDSNTDLTSVSEQASQR